MTLPLRPLQKERRQRFAKLVGLSLDRQRMPNANGTLHVCIKSRMFVEILAVIAWH